MKSAIRVVATVFGLIVALAGIEHGIGEILQGNTRPSSLVFESWPGSPFFEILSGEPAMSLIPNLLISGVLTVIFSLALLVWSILAMRTKSAAIGLILFSIILLLVGGGLGPPLMLLIVGLAATRIGRPFRWWRSQAPDSRVPLFARLWRPAVFAGVVGYLALLPGVPIAEQLVGPLDAGIVVAVIAFSFGSFFLSIIAALAFDSYIIGKDPRQIAISQ